MAWRDQEEYQKDVDFVRERNTYLNNIGRRQSSDFEDARKVNQA